MNFIIAVGGCLMAVAGTGLIGLFLFGSFPDTGADWPDEDDEKLWPTP